jgi:hypothetical protein
MKTKTIPRRHVQSLLPSHHGRGPSQALGCCITKRGKPVAKLVPHSISSNYPNDPVDRIIGATALIEDIPLLTADCEIRTSRAVPTIW